MKGSNILFFTLAAAVVIQCYSSVTAHSLDRDFHLLYITPSSNVPCPVNPCLTLSQLAANSSRWLTSSKHTTLMLLSGNHTLNTDLSVSNINNFFMLSNATSDGVHVIISCQYQVSFNFKNMTELSIKGLMFIGCGGNTFSSIKNFTIENSTFRGQNESGTVLDVTKVNLTILNSYFISNSVGRCLDIFDISTASHVSLRVGGAIFVDKSNVSIINCLFVNNSAEIGGAIYSTYYEYNNISISNSTFVSNRATSDGHLVLYCNWPNHKHGSVAGAIAVFQSEVKLTDCIFTNNTSEIGEGGVLSVQQYSTLSICRCQFHGNSANSYGGVFIMREISVTIDSSVFTNNSANQGGVMHAMQITVIELRKSVFRNNSAYSSGGVLSMDQMSQLYDYHGQFHYNRATTGGVLYAIRSGVILEDSAVSHNQAKDRGGAIYVLQSQANITFIRKCNLTHNSASTGGAICAIESTIISTGSVGPLVTQLIIAFNTANDIGGGIYLHRSVLNFIRNSINHILSNSANISGGGIYATNSLVICTEYYRQLNTWPFQTLLNITNNSALKGGGLFLESAAQLRIQRVSDVTTLQDAKLNTSIHFTSNRAEYGTAVYVADETYFDVCSNLYNTINSTATSNADCFIQVFSEATIEANKSSIANIEFREDNFSKSVIFGGLMDRCIPDPHRAEIYANRYIQKEIDGFTYLKLISNIDDTEYIRSLPVRVCFCTHDSQLNCSYEPPIIHVKKGESFNTSLVAVDQVNHTFKNVEIYSSLIHTESNLGEGQTTQATRNACTNLTFNVYSTHDSEELILYPEGPCRSASRSQSRLHIVFQPCTCPIGFQPTKYDNNDCICVCDSRLSPYFSDTDNNCNIQTKSLARHGNFWIGFINDTTEGKNSSGFLIYPYCPLDYCLPPTSNVYINLNLVSGADVQCANRRSGLLCSLCQPGLSLSLGSSQCMLCSKSWYKSYMPVILITLTMVGGILLVVLLLTLRLTVDIGTLNGLIFYVNIIGANSSTFFSGLPQSTKFYSVIVAWINLEVGYDACFFEGMDTYCKTWLQLAFPAYVIFLVIIVIIACKRSGKFSRLLSKRNPVATLATLILLSYTKFLQTTIAALSIATLHYPDGSHKRVWLPDATIEYLSRKHIPLFVVAVAILIIGAAYTCVIFFWQWLLHYQETSMFRNINTLRLNNFIDPYHAPYVEKYRYWTGLLLFMRIVLYLVFALNVSGDPGVNLMAINASAISLLLLKAHFGKIYKNKFVDIMEMACYANLGIFSTIKLKFVDGKIVSITAYISGAFTAMLLLIIVCHSIYYAILNSKCSKRHTNLTESQFHGNENSYDSAAVSSSMSKESYPTYSVVDMQQLADCGKQSSQVDENDKVLRLASEMNDDGASESTDSTSPLLNECD